jgi:beta-N-acetylhexosaminidase
MFVLIFLISEKMISKIQFLLKGLGILFVSFLLSKAGVQAEYQNLESPGLKVKIGQMLLLGFRGTVVDDSSYITKVIKDLHIGGVVLFDYDVPSGSFPRNIVNPKQTKTLISNLQSRTIIPLFIAVDAEGGRINRLKEKYGFIKVPSAQELGKKEPENTRTSHELLARQLSSLGINVNLAPVVDVNVNPKNPIIGSLERSFSSVPEKVLSHASTSINVHHKYNIITCLKHFPGHGSSRDDSHLGMVDITDTFNEEELFPYKHLIRQDQADIIMTAHVMNKTIDPDWPATLSPAFITSLLREKLGYDGLVMTDDMEMGAIQKNFGFAEAIVRAINAGCDIIALANNSSTYSEKTVYKAYEAVYNAVKTGKISLKQIDSSYQKIISLKQKFKIIQK